MTPDRRLPLIIAVIAAALATLSLWPTLAEGQTTTSPTTPSTTVRSTTSTTRVSTSTTRPVTSTTIHPAPDEGRFDVAPRMGAPGATIRISDVIPNCPTPSGKTVLVAIGMGNGRSYGSHIIATASTKADGSWGGTINVPNIPSGTYEMYASCFVQHPGQYDDELLLPYSGPTFVVTGSPVTAGGPTTSIAAEPASKRSNESPWLALGIVIAAVIALAAIIYAFIMRSRVSHGGPPKN